MNTPLDRKKTGVSLTVRKPFSRLAFMHGLTWLLVTCALMTGVLLLLSDIFSLPWSHAPISAAPLLLIGAAYLAFQLLSGPTLLDLFKALIVCCAFLLWGVDQLLPPGWIATTLGDVVIVLYVIDLGWMLFDRLRQGERNKQGFDHEE